RVGAIPQRLVLLGVTTHRQDLGLLALLRLCAYRVPGTLQGCLVGVGELADPGQRGAAMCQVMAPLLPHRVHVLTYQTAVQGLGRPTGLFGLLEEVPSGAVHLTGEVLHEEGTTGRVHDP